MKRMAMMFNTLGIVKCPILTIFIFCSIMLSVDAASPKKETILRLFGSNTIGADLAPVLAEEYLKILGAATVERIRTASNTGVTIEGRFPDKDITNVIEIRFDGSSTGFESLKNRTCDIAMSSRKIKDSEADALASLGDMTDVSCEHVLALDGIAIIINPSNTLLSRMDMKDLARVFSGEVVKWDQLGGSGTTINVHARDDKSGTHAIFKQVVLRNTKLSKSARCWISNEEISIAVSSDQHAIGYCGLPYAGDNTVLKIYDGSRSVLPTRFSIGCEDYPLTRRLYLYTPANPDNAHVVNFIAFALGKGQHHVNEQRFIPLTITAVDYPIQMIDMVQRSNVFNAYIAAVSQAKRLSVNYRFKTAGSKLDSRAMRDLDRVAEFLVHKPAQEVILAGFADNRGNYQQNYLLSCDRAKIVKEELQSRGITVHTLIGVSEEVPVASNASRIGQAKNRRVEIWIK